MLERTFLVEVEIIARDPEENENPRQHHSYRIHSQFINANHRMQPLVMLDERNR